MSRLIDLDRCWNTLGLAIRIGQGIGLHVDSTHKASHKRTTHQPKLVEQELRRRAWYSMYVLDRLLALQLGRPMAIQEEDFAVLLPSREEINSYDDHIDALSPQSNDLEHNVIADQSQIPEQALSSLPIHQPSAMDYLLHVIQFSHILGQVSRQLYHPTQIEFSPEAMLPTTRSLNATLLDWKEALPEHLRFDLGHTFEKSKVFKRQVRVSIQQT